MYHVKHQAHEIRSKKRGRRTFSWCMPRKVTRASVEVKISGNKKTKVTKTVEKSNTRTTKETRAISSAEPTRRAAPEKDTEEKARKRTHDFERTAKLAEPRTREPPLTFSPVAVKEWALYTTASERVARLAAPRNRLKSIETGDAYDPFKVRPAALVATCSSRTSTLAKPRAWRVRKENSFES